MPKTKKAIALSSQAKMLLVVTSEPNLDPGRPDTFVLSNFGSEPEVRTLHIDTDPGELHKPVRFICEQTGPAVLISGAPPSATYEASFKAIEVPVPHSFLAIINKMNEGQFLKLGPNSKGMCSVPLNRRAVLVNFLGFASMR